MISKTIGYNGVHYFQTHPYGYQQSYHALQIHFPLRRWEKSQWVDDLWDPDLLGGPPTTIFMVLIHANDGVHAVLQKKLEGLILRKYSMNTIIGIKVFLFMCW